MKKCIEFKEFNECTNDDINLIHSEKYIENVENRFPEDRKPHLHIGEDTYYNKFTPKAAKISCQGVLLSIDKVV